MKRIEKVSIIGLGAIGSAYASQIIKFIPGENVRVIAGGERANRYKTAGININGENFTFNVIDPAEECPAADLLIFAVKFNQLEEAVKQAKNHVGPDTIIISLLNGITSEEFIGREYGREKILYALTFGIDAVRVGNSVSFASLGTIPFGEAQNIEGHYSEKVIRLQEFFDRTRINYSIPQDMIYTLWWKLMVNVGINQTSAILRAPYGVFQNVEETRKIMIAAMQEVVDISREASINLSSGAIGELMEVLKRLAPEGKTSMLQDIEAGRETEVNIFAGAIAQLGQKYGVATPVNNMLYDIIKAQEGIFKYHNHISK